MTLSPVINSAGPLGWNSSSRMRIGQTRETRLLQHGDNFVAVHRWELLQKNVESITGSKVVKKALDRDARSDENRGAVVSF